MSQWPFSFFRERLARDLSLSRHQQVLSGALVLLGLLSLGGRAGAQVAVRPGPNFFLLEGASGVDGCLPRDLAKDVLRDRVLAANEEAGVDPQIAVVFSLEVPPCADLFYAPVSNDVRGIGYQHLYPEETFDESPDAALEGVAFLNDVPYWEVYPDELRRAFLHEVGHRWGVRVHVAGEEPTALLGRDREHWSYFLDSSSARGVSPLEGNVWQEEPSSELPEFVTVTDGAAPGYSDLDLYLMGLKGPEEVRPFRVLVPEEGQELTDCRGARLDESSPPERCGELRLRAREREFSLAHVLAVEGPRDPAAREPAAQDPAARDPAAATEPVVASVGFYFFTSEGKWTREGCDHWQAEAAALEAAFEAATGGRMTLVNVNSRGPGCAQLLAALDFRPGARNAPWTSSSESCALGRPSRTSGSEVLGLFSALLVAGAFGLRRARAVPARSEN